MNAIQRVYKAFQSSDMIWNQKREELSALFVRVVLHLRNVSSERSISRGIPRPAPRPAPSATRSDFLYESDAPDEHVGVEHVSEVICVTIVELPDEVFVELVVLLVVVVTVP